MRLARLVGVARRNSLYLLAAAAAVTLITVYLAVLWVPTALYFTSPNAQRIFYFHVPAAWVSYLSFGLLTLFSVAYLRTENPAYDRWAQASSETALVFATVTLLSGTLWMRAEWLDSSGEIVDRFLWDTRLSLTLVMWFVLAAYHVLRKAAPTEEGARLCGVLGVFGFVSVPLSFLSARFLRSDHPNIVESSEGSISGSMIMTMNVGLLAFTLLMAYLLLLRVQLLKLRAETVQTSYQSAGD